MKDFKTWVTLLSLLLILKAGFGQTTVDGSLGLNLATVNNNLDMPDEGGIALFGLQAGVGVTVPFCGPWSFSPMLWCTQGGDAFKDGNYRWGTRKNFLQLALPVGFSHDLDDDMALRAEVGPSANYWTRAVYFDNYSGTTEKSKVELKGDDYLNRLFLSGSVGIFFDYQVADFGLSVGLKGEWGLTPIQSYEDFNGDLIKYTPQSFVLEGGITYPIDNLLGLGKDRSDYTIDLAPAELMYSTPYDETYSSYDKARKWLDQAFSNNDPDTLPNEFAQRALDELENTKKKLESGIEAWESGNINGIGPTTATKFREDITLFETRARALADSVFTVPGEEDDGDDPRDTPPPVIYGEEIDPPWITIKGAMSTSQGVWQDDDYFVDQLTKQLTIVSDNTTHSELDMVAGRWTAVFGTKGDGHTRIRMSGRSTYSQNEPVKLRLKLIQNGSETILWEQPESEAEIPIAGGQGPEKPWGIMLYNREDTPIPKTFKLDPGKYELKLEILRNNGEETGLEIKTFGNVVETNYPPVSIVPVAIGKPVSTEKVKILSDDLTRLTVQCQDRLPMFFPIREGGISVVPEPLQLLQYEESDADSIDPVLAMILGERRHIDNRVAILTQRFATGSQLTGGGKVIVIVTPEDYALLRVDSDRSQAFAAHSKVHILRVGSPEGVVAHELIHTTPFLWSRNEMISACKLNYHNDADRNYGNGAYITSSGAYIMDGRPAVMGGAALFPYITQCSFWHLLKQMQGEVDPPLYLIRGYLSNVDESFRGKLLSTFEFDGIEGLPEGVITPNGWGIVLRDRSGQVLSSFPFTPDWMYSDSEEPREIIAINYRINRPAEATAVIELVGPDGVLDSQRVSENAPEVNILSPKGNAQVGPDGSNSITVQWSTSDLDGDKVTAMVFYSDNNGEHWRLVGDEMEREELQFVISKLTLNARIRVVVTDGVRTATDEVSFSIMK